MPQQLGKSNNLRPIFFLLGAEVAGATGGGFRLPAALKKDKKLLNKLDISYVT